MNRALIITFAASLAWGQNFPTSVSTTANIPAAANRARTTLATTVNNSATTIVLTSASRFAVNTPFTIGTEDIICTSLSTNTFSSCTRGYDGSTAASHTAGVAVTGTIIAAHNNKLRLEVIAIETALGASMEKVVAPSGNVATATALAANPTDCSSNQFANAIAASGNLTCAAPLTLTTTGTSGAATFTGGTLNIPQYTGGGTGNAAETITVSYSATPTCTATTNTVTVCAITLTGNVTSCTLAGLTSGQAVTWRITQDGTGGRTFACASLTGLGPVDTTAAAVSSQDFRATSSSAATAAGGMTGTSSNVLLTDATNTGTAAFKLNASASTDDEAVRVPNVAGAANTSNGAISYDTTNKNMHAGTNGADGILPIVASVPTNGNCPKWVVSSSKVSLSNDTCSGGGASCVTSANAGTYYLSGPPGSYTATVALSANETYFVQITPNCTIEFNSITIWIDTASGTCGGTCGLAFMIYTDSGTLVATSNVATSGGSPDINSTGTKVITFAAGQTLTVGTTYKIAYTTDSTALKFWAAPGLSEYEFYNNGTTRIGTGNDSTGSGSGITAAPTLGTLSTYAGYLAVMMAAN